MAETKMYTHSHPYTTLLTHLSSHLPYCGPLLRRIQYQVTHRLPTAHVLATFPESGLGIESEDQRPWLAAYADIHRGPDTQVWLFSSLEAPSSSIKTSPRSPLSPNKDDNGNALGHFKAQDPKTGDLDLAKSQLHSLFTFINSTLIPPYLESLPSTPTAQVQKEEGVKKIPAHPKTSFLLGTIHIGIVGLISEISTVHDPSSNVRILRGKDVFYTKYCFPSSSFSVSSSAELERVSNDGYTYTFTSPSGISGIQESHLDLVKNRTNIPRSKEALLAMGGVALFHSPSPSSTVPGTKEEEMPISWAFLGFDGSLCSLHVEVEHRGKGLGGVVGKEVMKRGGDVFGSTVRGPEDSRDKVEWFYADVSVANTASKRVMEKMGGEVGWTTAWMVVEVDN
ncbi:hypothetical protein BJX99DRAFT_236468 [Aspergillus californicus]